MPRNRSNHRRRLFYTILASFSIALLSLGIYLIYAWFSGGFAKPTSSHISDEEVSCKELPIVQNGQIIDFVTNNSTLLIFACNAGFTPRNSNQIECDHKEGNWHVKGYCASDNMRVDPTKQRDLFEACRLGNTTAARTLLLKEEVNVNTTYDSFEHGQPIAGEDWMNGITCLMFATFKGHAETVKMLVHEFRADVNFTNVYGNAALYSAAGKGYLDIVHFLYEDGKADLEVKNQFGWTPLMGAALTGKFEVVEYLLGQGANALEKDNEGRTAYDLATRDNIKELLKPYAT